MAKLSAHGSIVGTVEWLTTAKRYMSDGVVLKNTGAGWKRYGKVKEGFTPLQAYESAKARLAGLLAGRTEVQAYFAELHDLAPISKRWKLHAAVEAMPGDPDGVWSEVCDGYSDNVAADIADIVKLCRLYQAAYGDVREVIK